MNQILIRLIKVIYSEIQLAELVNGHLSEWFPMTVGNRQGDPLSPRSFVLFLDRRIDKIKSRENSGVSVQIKSNQITFICFSS